LIWLYDELPANDSGGLDSQAFQEIQQIVQFCGSREISTLDSQYQAWVGLLTFINVRMLQEPVQSAPQKLIVGKSPSTLAADRRLTICSCSYIISPATFAFHNLANIFPPHSLFFLKHSRPARESFLSPAWSMGSSQPAWSSD